MNIILKLLPGFSLILCFFIYYPGSFGGFIFDDYPNIISNLDIRINSLQVEELIRAAFSSYSGYFQRPVSMLTFAINHYYSGFTPYYYKVTNIIIHLINGCLVGLLALLILRLIDVSSGTGKINIKTASLIVALIWTLHPINLTSVLYVVQRMNELAAMFTFMGLCFYVSGRKSLLEGGRGWIPIAVAMTLCGPMAILSKENGALMYFYILLIEFLLFKRNKLNNGNRYSLYGLFAVFILIPTLAAFIYIYFNPEIIVGGYAQKSYDLMERLLTETRVIWFYLSLIILPNIQKMSLHHDDIQISSSLIDPVTTLVSIIGLFFIIIFSIQYRKKHSLVLFSLLFFLIGHSMESTVVPLIIAFEHRNYVPSFGIILLLTYFLMNKEYSQKTLHIRYVALFFFTVILAFSTNIRARQWGNAELLRFHELRHNPDSAAVNYEVGRFYASSLDTVYIQDRTVVYEKAKYYFARVLELQPHNIEALIGLLILENTNTNLVDKELQSRLLDVLENQQINSTATGAIKALLTCQYSSECNFTSNYINQIVNSITRNSRLYGRNAELVFTNISRYYLKDDINKALEMAEKGVLLNPDSMDMRLYYANILVLTDDYERASAELEWLEKSNKLGIFNSRINELKDAVNSRN